MLGYACPAIKLIHVNTKALGFNILGDDKDVSGSSNKCLGKKGKPFTWKILAIWYNDKLISFPIAIDVYGAKTISGNDCKAYDAYGSKKIVDNIISPTCYFKTVGPNDVDVLLGGDFGKYRYNIE